MHYKKSYVETQQTTNSYVFRKTYKKYICKLTGKCDYCPWHNGENNRSNRRHYSWKVEKRVRHQYEQGYINPWKSNRWRWP
jgi:hypothetical protein